ncbi:sialidase family protein [Paenibacillus hodogayensis]|uniref:Sialidase family protein n=1 Tax=Paenibacillus hodogayensis TaxID=279208 RepID=A0ABV5W2Y7_9BACL
MQLQERELALQPVEPNLAPGEKYAAKSRKFQGIPTIERAPGGRLWAAYYSGGDGEGPDNYVVLVHSGDDGRTWSVPWLVIDPPGKVRAFDPCLWIDPLGRLWLCWAQSFEMYDGRCGVWASLLDDPDEPDGIWSAPRRIANGIMMNKPTVLRSGEWLFPTAVWAVQWAIRLSGMDSLPEERFSNVYVSTDQGESFALRGQANVPNRFFDEHMIVEHEDESLRMLVRTTYGIGESHSTDKGLTWSRGKPTRLGGPNSRFYIRRLRSGRLLLVNHYGFNGRSHLTAQVSEDDGMTWTEGLLLDERENVSYPDGTEAADGTIYIIYDRERKLDMDILMAVFKEEDVLAGRCVTPGARLKVAVDKGGA